jgi:pyruvate formate lyase activating enzyme
MQSDFLLSLTEELHGYHLCIESSGYCDEETFRKVVSRLDMVIMDIKLADRELHLKYTGVSNERILNNLKYLQECGVEHVIRTPLIPGVTDTHDNLSKTAALVGASTWEKLPYNPLAGAKYKSFGMTYPLDSL